LGSRGTGWSALSLLVAAYAVGHLLSPGAKLVQRVTERYPKVKPKDTNKDVNAKDTAQDVKAEDTAKDKKAANLPWWWRWTRMNSDEEKKQLKPVSMHYDWLRVKSLDAAGLAAKLRAEFTM